MVFRNMIGIVFKSVFYFKIYFFNFLKIIFDINTSKYMKT
jgi:hypothetical protein